MLLQGILGLPLILPISTLIAGIRGADLSTAYSSMVSGVRDIFQNPQNETSLPQQLTQDEYKKAVSDAITEVVVNMDSDVCVQKASEWIQLFNASDDGAVRMSHESETRTTVENNNDGSKGDEQIEANVTNTRVESQFP